MAVDVMPRLLARFGEVELYQVLEITIPTSVRWFLQDAAPDEVEAARNALDPVFFDENRRIIQSIHTYVLKSPGRVVLIDTGVGNQKSRAGGIPAFDMLEVPFLERLAAIGVEPGDVSLVLCTHMHVDHLGWDTYRDGDGWAVTFPNARHLFVDREWEAFKASIATSDGQKLIWEDTIEPLEKSGLIDLVPPDYQVAPDIRLEPSHGHTPGHVNIVVEGGGQKAVFIGDAMHGPIQVIVPDANSPISGGPVATAARRKILADYVDTGTMVFGAHFASPCGGYVRSNGEGYSFVPITLPG